MTRQEKRVMADLRHRDRENRLRNILAAKKKPVAEPGGNLPVALVIAVGPGTRRILQDGETRFIRCTEPVAPGDEVLVRHEKVAGILPRRTTLARTDPSNPERERVIVANIDLLVIVAAIADPPFRPGLVDRYLVAAARGGTTPLLCVTKADLATPAEIEEAIRPFSIPSVRCSTKTGQGIEDLRALLAGNLSVFAGHSGVGKSSLLNALSSQAVAATGQVSDNTGKGRHTTTSSSLFDLGNGARIIDTPGIREFGLGRLTLRELRAAFPEFEGISCRFSDCTHRQEPGCEVRDKSHPRHAAWLRISIEL